MRPVAEHRPSIALRLGRQPVSWLLPLVIGLVGGVRRGKLALKWSAEKN